MHSGLAHFRRVFHAYVSLSHELDELDKLVAVRSLGFARRCSACSYPSTHAGSGACWPTRTFLFLTDWVPCSVSSRHCSRQQRVHAPSHTLMSCAAGGCHSQGLPHFSRFSNRVGVKRTLRLTLLADCCRLIMSVARAASSFLALNLSRLWDSSTGVHFVLTFSEHWLQSAALFFSTIAAPVRHSQSDLVRPTRISGSRASSRFGFVHICCHHFRKRSSVLVERKPDRRGPKPVFANPGNTYCGWFPTLSEELVP